jgi:DNA-binding transcriptional ArsR family regulator
MLLVDITILRGTVHTHHRLSDQVSPVPFDVGGFFSDAGQCPGSTPTHGQQPFGGAVQICSQARKGSPQRRAHICKRPSEQLSRGLPLQAVRAPLQVTKARAIVNYMVQSLSAHLDASFAALSDATRRGVLEQLGRADASITALADKFHMTLTGMKKHVGVLEQAGLVTTEKVGRVRTCRLGLRRLEEETKWIERYRQLWDARFDELDKVVEELKRKERVHGRRK